MHLVHSINAKNIIFVIVYNISRPGWSLIWGNKFHTFSRALADIICIKLYSCLAFIKFLHNIIRIMGYTHTFRMKYIAKNVQILLLLTTRLVTTLFWTNFSAVKFSSLACFFSERPMLRLLHGLLLHGYMWNVSCTEKSPAFLIAGCHLT